MVMDNKPEQLRKAPYPIDVTELGMVMDTKPEQPSNAPPPDHVPPFILVTEYCIPS